MMESNLFLLGACVLCRRPARPVSASVTFAAAPPPISKHRDRNRSNDREVVAISSAVSVTDARGAVPIIAAATAPALASPSRSMGAKSAGDSMRSSRSARSRAKAAVSTTPSASDCRSLHGVAIWIWPKRRRCAASSSSLYFTSSRLFAATFAAAKCALSHRTTRTPAPDKQLSSLVVSRVSPDGTMFSPKCMSLRNVSKRSSRVARQKKSVAGDKRFAVAAATPSGLASFQRCLQASTTSRCSSKSFWVSACSARDTLSFWTSAWCSN
mmetsp:Transcript_55197/g.125549  ORF Transcript_55197/g.125549 Transcript_55197/m.125549 type:complete len:269 (-) Transcript_55197:138-944(-)